jgi:hypothetical protein
LKNITEKGINITRNALVISPKTSIFFRFILSAITPAIGPNIIAGKVKKKARCEKARE